MQVTLKKVTFFLRSDIFPLVLSFSPLGGNTCTKEVSDTQHQFSIYYSSARCENTWKCLSQIFDTRHDKRNKKEKINFQKEKLLDRLLSLEVTLRVKISGKNCKTASFLMDLFCSDVFCWRQYTDSFFQEKWKLFVFELFSYKITHAKYLSVMSELQRIV